MDAQKFDEKAIVFLQLDTVPLSEVGLNTEESLEEIKESEKEIVSQEKKITKNSN